MHKILNIIFLLQLITLTSCISSGSSYDYEEFQRSNMGQKIPGQYSQSPFISSGNNASNNHQYPQNQNRQQPQAAYKSNNQAPAQYSQRRQNSPMQAHQYQPPPQQASKQHIASNRYPYPTAPQQNKNSYSFDRNNYMQQNSPPPNMHRGAPPYSNPNQYPHSNATLGYLAEAENNQPYPPQEYHKQHRQKPADDYMNPYREIDSRSLNHKKPSISHYRQENTRHHVNQPREYSKNEKTFALPSRTRRKFGLISTDYFTPYNQEIKPIKRRQNISESQYGNNANLIDNIKDQELNYRLSQNKRYLRKNNISTIE
jgi:hypothetical protein